MTREGPMVSLSERAIPLAVASGDCRQRVNPTRRGPIVLATDGASGSGAAVVAVRVQAARLDLPLEVISVLEPTSTCAAGAAVASDPATDEARRYAREIGVRDYVSRYSGGATPPRVRVRFGSLAAEIGRFAREVSATMVVVEAPDGSLTYSERSVRTSPSFASATLLEELQ